MPHFIYFTAFIAILVTHPPANQTNELQDQVAKFISEDDFSSLLPFVENWQKQDATTKLVLLRFLSKHIASDKLVGLKNTADLIIPSRIKSGDLKTQGHGLIIDHDLFVVGGKAAWAISKLTKIEIPTFKQGQTEQERKNIIAKIEAVIKKLEETSNKPIKPN